MTIHQSVFPPLFLETKQTDIAQCLSILPASYKEEGGLTLELSMHCQISENKSPKACKSLWIHKIQKVVLQKAT